MASSRGLILTGGAAGATALLGASMAVRSAGQRIASTHNDLVDPLLVPPDDLAHHKVPSFDGGSLHVVERGSGPTVILLHGVTLQWSIWSPLFHLLGEDHRVLAWDMRGHGDSVAGSEGVSLHATATDLVTMLGELDVDDAVIVGHSMGGMALGRFLIDHRSTAQRRARHSVFLATSAAPMHPIAHDPQSFGHQAALRIANIALSSRARFEWAEGDLSRVMLSRAYGKVTTGAAVEQLRLMTVEMPHDAFHEATLAILKHDIREQLTGVETPATVITGTCDRLTPPRHAQMLASSLRESKLHLLDDIGHQVMQEDPHALVEIVKPLTGPF